MNKKRRSIVLITGSAGDMGSALAVKLRRHYTVIGTDRPGTNCDYGPKRCLAVNRLPLN